MAKIRLDYVTNSSSSSFVISKDKLTKEQIELLLDFDKLIELAKEKYNTPCKGKNVFDLNCNELNCNYYICEIYSWNTEETDDKIYGYTIMDNFDMIDFLKELGIPLTESDCGDFGAGMAGIAWLSENCNIDPLDIFKEDDISENKN